MEVIRLAIVKKIVRANYLLREDDAQIVATKEMDVEHELKKYINSLATDMKQVLHFFIFYK